MYYLKKQKCTVGNHELDVVIRLDESAYIPLDPKNLYAVCSLSLDSIKNKAGAHRRTESKL